MRKLRSFFRNGIWQPQFGIGMLFTALSLLLIHFDGLGPVKNLWLASGIFLVCWSLLKGCIGTLAPDVDDVSEVLWKKKDENDRPYYVIDRYGDSRVRIPTLLVFTKRWV